MIRDLTNQAALKLLASSMTKASMTLILKKIKDLSIAKHDISNKEPKYQIMNEAKANFDPRLNLDNDNKEERVAKFLDNIRKCAPDAVALFNFPVDQESDYPPPITEIVAEVAMKQGVSEQSMLEDFMAKLSFKESQLSELEKVT